MSKDINTQDTEALPEPINEVTRTAPEEIYLCVSDEPEDANLPFDEVGIYVDEGVTWSRDKPVSVAVKYTRADLAAAPKVLMKTSLNEEFPEPAGIIIEFDDQGNAVVDHACEGPYEELSEMQGLYTADQMHAHAAKLCAARDAEIERLRNCANMLYRHCVSLMETGRDRIISEGGQCDSVEVMEQSDPWLIEARAALREIK